MSNLKLLKVLNPVMAIAFLGVIAGFILYKTPLVPSLQGSEGAASLHEIFGLIFLLCAICHIILNWNWIKTQIFGIKPVKKAGRK